MNVNELNAELYSQTAILCWSIHLKETTTVMEVKEDFQQPSSNGPITSEIDGFLTPLFRDTFLFTPYLHGVHGLLSSFWLVINFIRA